MRIGKMDEPNNADALADLIEENNTRQLTGPQAWKNWWYYHKWHVINSAVLFATIFYILGTVLGLFTKTPDLQIAYVGASLLPNDTADALEQAFASLIEDFNKDGEILVRVNQYTNNPAALNAGTVYSLYASEITLTGDLSDCESYLFLLEDPQGFQAEHQLLAMPDGSCPEDGDYSAAGKVIPWSDCSLLSSIGMDSPAAAAEEQTSATEEPTFTIRSWEILDRLYLGRRCFPTKKTVKYVEECSRLWDKLAGNSNTAP